MSVKTSLSPCRRRKTEEHIDYVEGPIKTGQHHPNNQSAKRVVLLALFVVLGNVLVFGLWLFSDVVVLVPPERRMIDGVPESRVLVHLGKAGGLTVRTHLYRTIDYEVHAIYNYHYQTDTLVLPADRFSVHPNDHLYILVRDPLTRVVSAYNYRKETLQSGEERSALRCSLCLEIECFDYFESVNDLAEALYDDPIARRLLQGGCIQHWRENYKYYINPLVEFITNRTNQVDILRQEHLQEDMHRLFGVKWLGTRHKGTSGGGNAFLSEKARKNLKDFLADEYQIYYWLLKIKGLDP
eukprot:gb/GECG01009992.1/.p1 GENE.gb/GECG01009992.1/~~gb/GECG01009992.1/.p1  ORF type:complete len:297 (+),score=20.30 gb/GECG01009992.1/:1-891(+)